MTSNAIIAAKRMSAELGISDPTKISLETVAASKNILVREAPMDGADGRILMKDNSAIITINSKISHLERKRFILAHELGHFEMHRATRAVFSDTDETLNAWYNSTFGNEELEANEFAAEYLMPTALYKKACNNVCGDKRLIRDYGIDLPTMIDKLSRLFDVSLTATLIRFAETGIHPVLIVCCKDNIVKWFKPSDDFPHYRFAFTTRVAPRTETIASEAFRNGISFQGAERRQWIPKSAWFATKTEDNDDDFYEYCIHSKRSNYTISAIWEK